MPSTAENVQPGGSGCELGSESMNASRRTRARSGWAGAWRVAALLPACAGLVACAPKMHRVEPYRSDPTAADGLEARARAVCEAPPRGERTAPEKPFVTDGCSLWFDRTWDQCCVDHDIAYWCGGSAEERKQADRALRDCVDELTPSWLAWMTYLGVRIGGHPLFPLHYRWGFGRSYCPWYEAPAEDRTPQSEAEPPSPDG